MGQNQSSIDKAKSVIDQYGIGAGGTRNISGNNHQIVLLEKKLAELHQKEAALVFTSGYVANDASIQSLAKILPNLVIFSDEKNHASIISGIKNSRADKEIFKHNDLADLESLLKKYPLTQPKLIVFESVYSMDGDFGLIKEISILAKKYHALTFLDEVHAVGLYGKTGAGRAEEINCQNDIDIIQGTLAKSYGAIGGYIGAKKEIIEAIRSVASGFIFSTALPPMIAAAAIENISYLQNSEKERKILKDKVAKIKSRIIDQGIKIIKNDSHIISVFVGDAAIAKSISKKLLDDFDIYLQHINYPTVNKGDERLRITTTHLHSDEMISHLIDSLKACFD
jgi:5-aminolevulinate synthase